MGSRKMCDSVKRVIVLVGFFAIVLPGCSDSSERTIQPMQRIQNETGADVVVQYRQACGEACATGYTSLSIGSDAIEKVSFTAYSEAVKGKSVGDLQEPVRLEFQPLSKGNHICEQSPFDTSRYDSSLTPPAQYAIRKASETCPVAFADVGSNAE